MPVIRGVKSPLSVLIFLSTKNIIKLYMQVIGKETDEAKARVLQSKVDHLKCRASRRLTKLANWAGNKF